MPFRRAHQLVGQLVARAEKEGRGLAELPLAVLKDACGSIDEDVYDRLGAANVVKHYASEGAGGARQLGRQLAWWRRKLAGSSPRGARP